MGRSGRPAPTSEKSSAGRVEAARSTPYFCSSKVQLPDVSVAPTLPCDSSASADRGQSTLEWRARCGNRDGLIEAIEHAEEHGQRAAASLAPTIENLAMLRRQLEMGCSVESILEFMAVTGGGEKRRAADEAIHCYQHAVTELRALLMQALFAESGSRADEVGPLTGDRSAAATRLSEVDHFVGRLEVQSEER